MVLLNQYIVQFLESTFQKRSMLIAEKFIKFLVSNYSKHTVYTDAGTWYLVVRNVLRLENYLHSSFKKSLMERVNQYFKTEPRVLMTTIHVGKMIAIYLMSITGNNS